MASICTRLATRLRCVSITPFGRPVVPDEYGRTTTSVAGSMATAGGSASIAIDASDGTPGASSMVTISMDGAASCGRLARPRRERRRRDEQPGAGVAQLERDLVGRVGRVDGGQDGAEARDGVEDDGVLRHVGRPDRHDVALADAARQAGRDAAHLVAPVRRT